MYPSPYKSERRRRVLFPLLPDELQTQALFIPTIIALDASAMVGQTGSGDAVRESALGQGASPSEATAAFFRLTAFSSCFSSNWVITFENNLFPFNRCTIMTLV